MTSWNRSAEQLFGFASTEIIGRPSFRIVRGDGTVRSLRARVVAEVGGDGKVVRVTGTAVDETQQLAIELVRRAAETRFEIGFEQSAVGAVITDLSGIPVRVNASVRALLGRTDELTGLPNRLLLADRLIQGLAGSRRRGSQLGVMFLDLDQFKVVNDPMGHTSGDELLREAAARISTAIRPGDTVARFGGDEFVVVCDDVSADEATRIAERILEALVRPWFVAALEINVTASLGIAIADATATPESLLRDSDAAMYRAKARGRGRVELFDDTLRSTADGRMTMTSALHRALERGELPCTTSPWSI